MKRSYYLVLSLLLSSSLCAQFNLQPSNGECGTYGKPTRLQEYQNGLYDHLLSENQDTLKVGITIHLVGTTSGVGHLSIDRLFRAFDVLQKDFLAFNVLPFIEGEIRYINNSAYYEHDFSTGSTMMALNNLPNTINCYIVEDPAGNCGYYSPSRDGLVVAKNCMDPGDRTWSHELGHFLTLPHTFVGWDSSPETLPTEEAAPATVNGRQVEKTDSSNCSVAADGFCDTPLDYMSFTWNCNFAGYYPDSLIDPDGIVFAAEAGNIMSYVRDACLPLPGGGFSQEQTEAMEIDLISRGNLVEAVSCLPLAQASDVNLLVPEDGESIYPVDDITVLLQWTPAEHATHYLVEVATNSFFTALIGEIIVTDTSLLLDTDLVPLIENRRYFWRVRPFNAFSVLTGYSEEYDFRIEDLLSSNQELEQNFNLTAFPNPVSDRRRHVTISGSSALANEVARVELKTSQGQLLRTESVFIGPSGTINHQLSTAGVPAGLYLLSLSSGNRRETIKLIVR